MSDGESELGSDVSGDWVLDPQHSRIGFSARHAMVTRVRGAFNDVEGTIHVPGTGPAGSTVTVRLGAASIDTRSSARDAHLRSADFFDVERFPDIIFRSTAVDEIEERSLVVVGDLTIRDITRQVTVPIDLTGVHRDADGALRAGFEGSRRIDRRDFGLRWQRALDAGGVLVSERITLEFEISAVRVSAEASAAPGTTTAVDEQPVTTQAVPVRKRHRARSGGWFSRRRNASRAR